MGLGVEGWQGMGGPSQAAPGCLLVQPLLLLGHLAVEPLPKLLQGPLLLLQLLLEAADGAQAGAGRGGRCTRHPLPLQPSCPHGKGSPGGISAGATARPHVLPSASLSQYHLQRPS